MIVLTRLNGSPFAVNDDLIERIVESPDTTLFMVDGSSYIVTESTGDVIERICHNRAQIMAFALQKSADLSTAVHSSASTTDGQVH